jgi:hypothetical protein
VCSSDLILDVWGGDFGPGDPVWHWDPIAHFRDGVGDEHRSFGAAYYPWLHTTLVDRKAIDYTTFGEAAGRAALGALLLRHIGEVREKDRKAFRDIVGDMARDDLPAERTDEIDKTLAVASPLYEQLIKEARAMLNLMPPSAAMAGLYAMVDNSRGVWKAPANVAVNAVVRPAVTISDADQEDLNTPVDGKSVNAIRSFIGEGALVWGGRTLDGNSNEWRYISVRRTVIMLEESCRGALGAIAFEPNDPNTWTQVRTMISAFLTSVWKQGGLIGPTPDDAFSVQCGPGQTMTDNEVRDGILRVRVGVALVRPAEFIQFEMRQQVAQG